MKRTEIIPTLEKLFASPPFTIAKTYKICWLNGGLRLISSNCSVQPEIVFYIVHKSEIRAGLSSTEWNTIEGKVVVFLTQKGLL